MESKVPKNLWVSERNGMGFMVTETLFSEPAIEFYSSLIIWKLFKGGLRPSLLALEKQAMSSTDAQQGRVLPTATWSWKSTWASGEIASQVPPCSQTRATLCGDTSQEVQGLMIHRNYQMINILCFKCIYVCNMLRSRRTHITVNASIISFIS